MREYRSDIIGTRERADSFIPPRISVFPLAFPRPLLVPFLSLHSRFFLVATYQSSIPHVIFKFSVSLVPSLLFRRTVRPRLSFLPVQSRFFPSRSFFSLAVCSLSLSFILYSLLYLFLTFLFIPDLPIVLYRRSFTISLPVTWPRSCVSAFFRGRLSRGRSCRAAARSTRDVTIARGPGSILRPIDRRPAGLRARTRVPIYGKFRARPFFRGSREVPLLRAIFVFLFSGQDFSVFPRCPSQCLFFAACRK